MQEFLAPLKEGLQKDTSQPSKKRANANTGLDLAQPSHSHSMVAGGFELTS
jgi:hypothetical protein